MLTGRAEVARRAASRMTHRLRSLPILALSVHSACNCRCVMCDIWKANAEKREISVDDLERHVASIRSLHVQRVMLTGGEPLLHRNLWALCDRLREHDIRLTLVTTGLLLEQHAAEIAQTIDEVVISIDGPREVHDQIRRVPGGFDRIARGVQALKDRAAATRNRVEGGTLVPPNSIARCVIQQANFTQIAATIDATRALGVNNLSFLAADVSSTAFNRPSGWSPERQAEVGLSATDLPLFERSIQQAEERCGDALRSGFVVGGQPALARIYQYYAALNGRGEFPSVNCNAPWVSAVLEPGGTIRPCFFQPAYQTGGDQPLASVLNSAKAITARRGLDPKTNAICRRCVCSLSLPLTRLA